MEIYCTLRIDDGQLKICAQFPDLKSNVASKVTAKVDLLRSDLFAAVDDWCCQSADIRSKCAKARELSLCDEDLLVKGGTASPLQPSKAQLLLWAGQTDTTLYIQELVGIGDPQNERMKTTYVRRRFITEFSPIRSYFR